MVMSASTLAVELQNMAPVGSEVEAIDTLVDAYATFAADATAGAVPITAAGIDLGKAAMSTALVGMNAPGAGAAVIAAAVQAFWGAVALGLATSFPGATVVTPPPHATLSTGLSAQFAINTATEADLPTSTANVASVFYTEATIGGTVTFPPAVVQPIL